ncbi:hypothetical protein [Actinomadura keratinilytica]|jgi:hypothetical protein|uniref:Single-stranded DNA-binding protein n=1 Tax=Actinomadura keratinilytica TaxID=547461 RepID=A0ABP7ZFX8_9ACTN
MDNRFTVNIAGRLARDPELKSYDWGVRCELQILVILRKVNRDGDVYSAERTIRVTTLDTSLAGRIAREFKMGDRVEVVCDDIRPGRIWYDPSAFDPQTGERGRWKQGRERFIIAEIKKAPKPKAAAKDKTADAARQAEVEVLNGVTG